MLSCLIIEDEEPAQRILKKYVSNMASLELKKVFSNVIAAKEYLQQEPIDLIFFRYTST